MASQPVPTGLSEESWNDLYDFLDPDRGAKTGLERDDVAMANLREIRRKLTFFFAGRGLRDAEDLAHETIFRVAAKCGGILESYSGDRTRYFYGFAKNIFHEALKDSPPLDPLSEQGPGEPMARVIPLDSWLDEKKVRRCLDKCMDKLTKRTRELVVDYYSKSGAAKIDLRKKLADRLGKSINALRIQVHRIKQRVQNCVFECVDPEAAEAERSGAIHRA